MFPGCTSSAGLPVGVQVVAAFGRDDKALAAPPSYLAAPSAIIARMICRTGDFFLRTIQMV